MHLGRLYTEAACALVLHNCSTKCPYYLLYQQGRHEDRGLRALRGADCLLYPVVDRHDVNTTCETKAYPNAAVIYRQGARVQTAERVIDAGNPQSAAATECYDVPAYPINLQVVVEDVSHAR